MVSGEAAFPQKRLGRGHVRRRVHADGEVGRPGHADGHARGQGPFPWAMDGLPPAAASVVVLIQPVVAAWLGWILFAEPIGPLQGLGAAVTLGGVVLAQWASRKR